MKRRDLLQSAALAGACSLVARREHATSAAPPESPPESPLGVIDSNVHLFQWPTRRLPLDDLEALNDKLELLGVESAWAASFEGLLHRDISAVNERLVQACDRFSKFKPIGTLNPRSEGWQNDLQRCAQEFKMHGIRVYPNYHQYRLDDECFASLMHAATQLNLLIQIVVAMEDSRTQHPLLQVPDVDLAVLPKIATHLSDARIQVLNHRLSGSLLKRLGDVGNIYFDTARVEQTDGVATLVNTVSLNRVLFGSHSPFLIPEAAMIRVAEAHLSERELLAVLSENATRFAGVAR